MCVHECVCVGKKWQDDKNVNIINCQKENSKICVSAVCDADRCGQS